jgi:predicted 2-oxoglutarate/Fe(II)-dependent dioxygenase YbiX
MEVKNYIKTYDNVLPIETTCNLIRFANTLDFYPAGVIDKKKDNVNTSIRNANVRALTRDDTSMSVVHWASLLENLFCQVIDNYFLSLNLNNECTKLTDIALLKYKEGGHYKWHTDHHLKFPRTVSLIFLLNNEYEGGELCFRDTDKKEEIVIEKKTNRIIIWPSNFMYPHTVKPVSKGIRYSVVGWAC